jgi:copper chaperone CopZ
MTLACLARLASLARPMAYTNLSLPRPAATRTTPNHQWQGSTREQRRAYQYATRPTTLVRADADGTGSPSVDLEFNVSGMMCDGCTSRVEEELAKKDQVATVKADLERGLVTVTVHAADLSTAAGMMEDIVSEINGMGFEATPNL